VITTPFTRLVGCTIPLQQAGIGGVIPPELTAAVSNTGALGMLGAVMMPPKILAAALDRIESLTKNPYGINFLMPFVERECVRLVAGRARVVEFFYADPDPSLVEIVHNAGSIASWQIGSLEEAQAAARAGCDMIVAQGTEAGGHVRGKSALLPLLQQVLPAISIPVLAAGGIGTGRAMAAALAAGASGVRIGTRFVAARESIAHRDYVNALIAAHADDTVLTTDYGVLWPDAPHRVLRSAIDAAHAHPGDFVAEMDFGGNRRPLPKFHIAPPDSEATGNIAAMALYAGESVDAVTRIQPAADIVREIASEAESHLLLTAKLIKPSP
jgi:nitronate monooxygenase